MSEPRRIRELVIFALKLALAVGLFAWLYSSGRLELGQLARVADRWPWLLPARGRRG